MSENGKKDDLDSVLGRYLAIQQEEQRLKQEKSELQEVLAAHMRSLGEEQWFPELAGKRLKVRYRERTVLDYNDELLRQRLADKYGKILAPDIRKIRKRLDKISPLLEPVINEIGSPSSEKVRLAIESGVLKREDFSGAFEKTVKRYVSVATVTDA